MCSKLPIGQGVVLDDSALLSAINQVDVLSIYTFAYYTTRVDDMGVVEIVFLVLGWIFKNCSVSGNGWVKVGAIVSLCFFSVRCVGRHVVFRAISLL